MKMAVPALAVLALAAGCAPPPVTIDFVAETDPPVPVTLTATSISIPQGVAVGVHAEPMQQGAEMDSSAQLQLAPAQAGIVGVDPSPLSNFSYVIYGISAGTTELEVRANGQSGRSIQVTVTAPASP